MKRTRTLFYVLVVLNCIGLNEAMAENSSPFYGGIAFKTAFDDNIFQYSDGEIDEFEAGQAIERYPIETRDDLILSVFFDVGYRTYLWDGHTTLFKLRYAQYQYWQNKERDYQSFSLTAMQYFSPSTHLRINYYVAPEKYFRHYFDEDIGDITTADSFLPFTYKEHQLSAGIQHQIVKPLTLELYTKFGFEIFEEHFTEYDSDFFVLGGELEYRLSKQIRIRGGYAFLDTDCDGYDDAGETLATSDDKEYSHEENQYSGGITVRLPRIMKKSNTFSIDYRYRERNFTTEKDNDYYHYGRQDKDYTYTFGYHLRLNKHWQVSLEYDYQNREVDVPLLEEINEVKDFTRQRVEFGIAYDWN